MGNCAIKDLNGDSSVMEVYYANGKVSCLYIDGTTGEKYRIQIKTDVLYSEKDREEGSVQIRIYDMKDYIPIEQQSGIFKAPDDFGQQMKLYRKGFHLALGRKQSEYPYFIKIEGYNTIVGCPIRSEEDIFIILEDEQSGQE